MTPESFRKFDERYRSRKETGAALELSQPALRRYLAGEVRIPRYIALACAALVRGLPPLQ